jgi:hypothetical protein
MFSFPRSMFRTTLFALAAAPIPQGAPELPPGLVLHYDAAVGLDVGISMLVASWSEATALGPSLEQPDGRFKPYRDAFGLNGTATVHFDQDDWMQSEHGMPTSSATRALLVRVDSLKKGGVLLGADKGDGLLLAAASPYPRFEQGGQALVSLAPIPIGEFVTLLATYSAEDGQAELFLNGVSVAQGVLPALADDAISVGASRLGAYPLLGSIAEILVFDRVLDASERAAVEAYLTADTLIPFPLVTHAGLPRDAALLPRDASNLGTFEVSGTVFDPSATLIGLTILREGVPFAAVQQHLSQGTDGASFTLTGEIEAGLFDHTLELWVQGAGDPTVVARRESVVAGDAFLIDGQSNAVAKDWHAEGLGDLQQSHWIRSFGNARYAVGYGPPVVVYKTEHPKDLHWDLATSLLPHEHCTIGQWALRAARILMEGLQVPIAMINGGVEGSAIQYHLRNDLNPTDPARIYGRMLYRAQEAGIAGKARALLYSQGEADGLDPLNWQTKFGQLLDDWREDYPGLERIYAVQINEGCGIFNDSLRELQRRLGTTYPGVTVLSSNAVPSHDSCHYYHVGYLELGQRFARQVARDLYGFAGSDVEPPMILAASWTTPAQDTLLLSFGPPGDSLLVDPGVIQHMSVNDGTPVISVEVVGQQFLRVRLAAKSSATTVTWRGHQFDGPWIQNANGVGALAFFEFPITPPPEAGG